MFELSYVHNIPVYICTCTERNLFNGNCKTDFGQVHVGQAHIGGNVGGNPPPHVNFLPTSKHPRAMKISIKAQLNLLIKVGQ